MNAEDELLKKRFMELSKRSYNDSRFTFTNFLSLAELSVFYEAIKEIPGVEYSVFGGTEDAERVIVRFGSEDELGYNEAFPITILEISPLMEKFSDDLTHRDFLGALMNLGIEREVLGDILLKKNKAYLFVLNSMVEYISKELTRVKHTSIKVRIVDSIPEIDKYVPSEKLIQAASLRIDAVIARVLNLSRGDAIELFTEKKVFLNGRLCENNSKMLSEKDKVTVRGFGRFEVFEIVGKSKKGKENIKILL